MHDSTYNNDDDGDLFVDDRDVQEPLSNNHSLVNDDNNPHKDEPAPSRISESYNLQGPVGLTHSRLTTATSSSHDQRQYLDQGVSQIRNAARWCAVKAKTQLSYLARYTIPMVD